MRPIQLHQMFGINKANPTAPSPMFDINEANTVFLHSILSEHFASRSNIE